MIETAAIRLIPLLSPPFQPSFPLSFPLSRSLGPACTAPTTEPFPVHLHPSRAYHKTGGQTGLTFVRKILVVFACYTHTHTHTEYLIEEEAKEAAEWEEGGRERRGEECVVPDKDKGKLEVSFNPRS